MHREGQILDAVKTAVEEQTGLAVFLHRTLPLNAEDQELPAACINAGADTPTGEEGYDNLAYIDSVCELGITLYAQGSSQEEVASELDRLRVLTHKAMLASPRDLGLTFVIGIRYGGAAAPEYSDSGSPLAGKREVSFSVLYRMNLTDPE
jgi:hypothetical protein